MDELLPRLSADQILPAGPGQQLNRALAIHATRVATHCASAHSEAGTRAAQYVRMSTEHQQYSTDNQMASIRRYAERRGLAIVRTYADAGRSGLRLDGREALVRLIRDVQDGSADFETILVYDVSRWGRFQDIDESAHYEYLCRRAGIGVHYCAEQFENDGSPISAIIKGIKRAMAGEYSRELSTKVFAGQSRLAEMGFHVGAVPGFGLRRMLVDQYGTPKGELAARQYKSISTDRVILVPGPAHEVAAVRWVYRQFVHEGLRETAIFRLLVQQGIPTHDGGQWTPRRVHALLTNAKYAGDNVWNRVSTKLGSRQTSNSPNLWVRREVAFEPIVERSLFNAAQAIIQRRPLRLSDENILQSLSSLHTQEKHLSSAVINRSRELPRASTYTRRFGSLMQAYAKVGWTPPHGFRAAEVQAAIRRARTDILARLIEGVRLAGGQIDCAPHGDFLNINGELSVGLIVVSCCRRKHRRTPCWDVSFDLRRLPDVVLVVRLDRENLQAMDYFLLPRQAITRRSLRLGDRNGFRIDSCRMQTLVPFWRMCTRTPLRSIT